MVEDHIQT
jgi:hypothetical protein